VADDEPTGYPAGWPRTNYPLLKRLADRPHPLLHIADDFEKQIREIPIAWTGEVFTQARTAHHLLDIVGIPRGEGYASDLDSRTWQTINLIITLRGQVDRIAAWHSRETADGGMVGDYCNECGDPWPCETRRMADGSHEDLNDQEGTNTHA
jgi:hypothetical protein